jgi:hypothetical protein
MRLTVVAIQRQSSWPRWNSPPETQPSTASLAVMITVPGSGSIANRRSSRSTAISPSRSLRSWASM